MLLELTPSSLEHFSLPSEHGEIIQVGSGSASHFHSQNCFSMKILKDAHHTLFSIMREEVMVYLYSREAHGSEDDEAQHR